MTKFLTSPWFLLMIAGLFEVGWAIGLKYTKNFSKPIPTIFTLLSLILSMALLGKAVEKLPIGTAYAVWVGIGALGAALLGILLFKEPVTYARLFFLFLLILAIIGLKITASH